MLNFETIDEILTEYTGIVIPAMIQQNYHLKLVKGGPDYPHLSEQSHFAHIINGAFGLVKLVQFMTNQNIFSPNLTEGNLRKALALYTLHDRHKATDFEMLGKSDFSIPLEQMQLEYERLRLNRFVEIDEHLMRAVNVHKRSNKHGDLIQTNDGQANFLYLLVRIADTMASVATPSELANSLKNYLKELGPAFLPKPAGEYGLYYHELKDVRGVLTNTIHNAVSHQLEQEFGFYPLLTFTTGTLYIGLYVEQADRDSIINGVVDGVLASLIKSGDEIEDAIRDGKRDTYYDFETFVYSFANVPKLLETVYQDCLAVAKPDIKTIRKDFDGLLSKKGLPEGWREDSLNTKLGISLYETGTFLEHWVLARRYLFYVDKILRALNPSKEYLEETLEWFLNNFNLPINVIDNLREIGLLWAKGGPGKYTTPIAYHFLRGEQFSDRAADGLPHNEVLKKLHVYTLNVLEQVDTKAGRQFAVESLGFREDLGIYLREHMYLSFMPQTALNDDMLAAYSTPKKKNPRTSYCSLCGRSGKFVQEARTGILGDNLQIFSNRMLPVKIVQGNRTWCPICHLEFIFRKLTGMGLPARADYNKSRRVYIYLLPTFSFTSEHIRLFDPLLRPFHRITNLNIRDYGKAWGVPRYWLEHRQFDLEWLEDLQAVLERTADHLIDTRDYSYGEHVTINKNKVTPHYYLIVWEKYAGEREKDDTRIATRTEAWAKAAFASTIIAGLTSCKVYVTERPFLPVIDPSKLKATITLDGPPQSLRGMLAKEDEDISLYGRENSDRSQLESTLDLSAALWTVTVGLKPQKDKDIAKRLERINIDPLAGAFFYKEYGRENEGKSPYSPFDIACELLLGLKGGELMDLVTKIAEKSLEIALPFGASGRGKARRYELVFREGISAMRKAQKVIPGMRQLALTGQTVSPDSITELKQLAAGTLLKGLERRQESRRGEIAVRAWGEKLGRLVTEFMDILVDDLYLGRANGNFAQLIRLENSIADGIYFYTDRNLSRLWKEHKDNNPNNNQTETTEE